MSLEIAVEMTLTCTKAKNMEQSEHGLSNSECLYIFFFHTSEASLVLGLVNLESKISLFSSHVNPILFCLNPPNRQSSPPFRGTSVGFKACFSRLICHIPCTL